MRATSKWYLFPSSNEVAKRAGGRRRYNAQRQEQALARRIAILELFGARVILNPRGAQALIARQLSMNRSTICRDIAAIRAEWRHQHLCPLCDTYSDLSFAAVAKLDRKTKDFASSWVRSCCVRLFEEREASRKRKRLSAQEKQFCRAIERL